MTDKHYIERQYQQAVREFAGAVTEDEQWTARKTMASFEAVAAQEYGFEYADQLHQLIEG